MSVASPAAGKVLGIELIIMSYFQHRWEKNEGAQLKEAYSLDFNLNLIMDCQAKVKNWIETKMGRTTSLD